MASRILWTSLTIPLLALALGGCEDSASSAKGEDASASTSSAPASAPAESAAPEAPKRRTGTWEVEAPGRGKAYTVVSKGDVVTLTMGGTVFTGKDDPKGRRYTTASGGDYLLEGKGDGFELKVKDGPTWVVGFDGDDVTLSSEGTTLAIAKAGDTFEVRRGDERLGEVVVEGDAVHVKAGGATTYQGKDGLVAGWGVLLLKDVPPAARRVLLAELLARG